MVDVGMGKHDIGEHVRVEGDDPVFFCSFLAAALKQSSVQYDPVLIRG